MTTPIDNYANHKTQALWQFPVGSSVVRVEIIGPNKEALVEDVEAAIEFLQIAKNNLQRAAMRSTESKGA
jgi:hypothetical protein